MIKKIDPSFNENIFKYTTYGISDILSIMQNILSHKWAIKKNYIIEFTNFLP